VARTTADLVKGVLLDAYGPRANGSLPDLTTFIDTASSIVDDVAACAVGRGKPLSTVKLELIERWVSAWLYTKADPTYSSRSTQGASGSFVQSPQEPENFKDGALTLDTSGCLQAILNRQRAGGAYLGKRLSEQIPYYDRE
jgi:hypothetical protein